MDKIILLSDAFAVTTDFLIKGIVQKPEQGRSKRADARIFSYVGTLFILIGIIATALYEWLYSPVAPAVGVVLMLTGCTVFAVGQLNGENKEKAKRDFWTVNVWTLSLIPVVLICLYIGRGAGLKLVGLNLRLLLLFLDSWVWCLYWFAWFAGCVWVDVYFWKRERK